MRALAVLVLVAALTGCIGSYGGTFGGPSAKKTQARGLRAATPGEFAVNAPWKGDPRPMKIRVWVDEDFRAQNLHWKSQLEEQIDDANQFLVPALGIRLEIVSYDNWPARSADQQMGDLLAALEQHDKGDDVAWVIGYVSSLSMVSASFDQLGVARPLGKHVVVRGFADAGERAYFARAFPKTKAADREAAIEMRRRHKQMTVLVHEVLHTLGAVHETDRAWIMHGTYNVDMNQLSDRSRELAQIVIDERLKPTGRQDVRSLAGRLVSYLDANPWGGWEAGEAQELRVYLRATMDSGPTTGGGGGGDGGAGNMNAPDVPVPPAAYDQLKRAQRLARQGKTAEALAELDALVAAYPGTAEIRQQICEVNLLASGPGSVEATTACDRAAEITPDDPRPFVAQIEAYLAKGEGKRAMALMAKVEERAGDQADVWDRVAAIYQAAGRISLAEQAATRSMAITKRDSHPIVEWAARTRARYGLPPDARRWKILPADEGDYVAAVRELLDLIYAGKTGEAQKQAKAAERRWRGAPGILGARCDLHLRLGEKGAAKKLCRQAITAWSGAAWAHYLEGVIALQEHRDAAGVVSLRAAIAADPELGQAYRTLGKALVRQKDTTGWAALSEEYQRRFGTPLPR